MSILKRTLSFLGVFHIVCGELSQYSFPDNFHFGVSSSAYQIEGGWNEGGKGVSIWDHSLHSNPDYVVDKSNGDIACDSYHKWKEDIAMLKNLGVQFYRFSISWTRIIPLGYNGSKVNEEGVKYYNDLIDALLAEGIQPFVTIYHWDLPQTLENKGGWLNESIVEDFVYYAKTLFELYGDRVKRWITINEYLQICEYGYSNATLAPFLDLAGVGVYQCSHHALLAHGRVYRLYQNQFKSSQQGEVGSVIQAFWCEPKTSSMDDQLAAEQYMQFNFGFYAHPIVYGNYPPIMIERIEALSEKLGFDESRLPRFTEQQIEMIKGSFDFLGVNHYTTILCSFNDNLPEPSLDSDCGVEISQNSTWKGNSVWWLRHVPWGFRKLLVWIKKTYDNPKVIILEGGWSTDENDLNDVDRVQYYREYLSEMLKAIYEDGCSVIGYAAWSFLDVFEWNSGYIIRGIYLAFASEVLVFFTMRIPLKNSWKKFGLIYVDFGSANRTRIPRKSYNEFRNIIRSNRIPNSAAHLGLYLPVFYIILCYFLKLI